MVMKKLLMICAVLLANSSLVSCKADKTIRPIAVIDVAPSYDGNIQDSGIISVANNGVTVTQRVIDRYVALVAIYGDEFTPSLDPQLGFEKIINDSPSNRGQLYLMEKRTLVCFIKMNQWKKMAKEPSKKKTPGAASRVIDAIISP